MGGRKLKVFQAQFGFYDTVVAAPSQVAALRAWETRQNLFASGDAKVTTDAAATAAALEQPLTPLRRAVGSNDPFQLEPASLPKIADSPESRPAKPLSEARPKARPPPDRAALDAAEAALDALEQARKREEKGFRARQAKLDAALTSAQETYVRKRTAAAAAVTQARTAYRRAGGEP